MYNLRMDWCGQSAINFTIATNEEKYDRNFGREGYNTILFLIA